MNPIPIRTSEQSAAVADIVFRQDLYPRIEFTPQLVQTYAETLELLPPIEVNQKNELIDGWHRWTAHKKAGVERIAITVTETASDIELLELAIERNAKYGLQLSQEDKRTIARRIYHQTPIDQQGALKIRLAHIFSVTDRTVQLWTSRIDKDNTSQRNATVLSLWLACETEDQIATRVGMARTGIEKVLTLTETFRLASNSGLCADIEDDEQRETEIERIQREAATKFRLALYSLWKQQERSTDMPTHFGNSEPQFIDNLLYLYTQPFDVVIDPFAGSGSTIDVCRKRFRRYWVADRKPIPEREHEIRKHDIAAGMPKFHLWKKVKLVFLDPPYWKQAEGQYSDDPEDLANMPLEQFHETLERIIKGFARKLQSGAVIALMMQPTQWNAPDHQYTDHVAEMLRRIDLPIEMRIQCPYESQQCNAQMVEWAKANRKLLVLTREIVVWKVV